MSSFADQDADVIKHLRERVATLEQEKVALVAELAQIKRSNESQNMGPQCPHHPGNYMWDAGCAGCWSAREDAADPTLDPATRKPWNQPCRDCGAEEGTTLDNGFHRCNKCGYPSQ